MKKYLVKIKDQVVEFKEFRITHNMQYQYSRNALPILSLVMPKEMKRTISISTIIEPNVEEKEPIRPTNMAQVREESWAFPFCSYWKAGMLPMIAHKLEVKSKNYIIIQDQLCRKQVGGLWFQCIMEEEVRAIISEVHEKESGTHFKEEVYAKK